MTESELVFRNALIFDGSGSSRFVGDVAVSDGRIDKVTLQASRLEAGAADEIDLAGMALAPGFIDAHTHDDRLIIDQPDAMAKISQGVTTVVTGNCGISLAPVCFEQEPPPPMNLLGGPDAYSFASMKAYAAAITNARPAVNVVALIGHSALRLAVMDDVRRPAGNAEIAAMRKLLAQCMDEGASGFSTGLYYPPNAAATPDEVAAVGEVASEKNGIYTTHMRDESDFVMDSLRESTETAKAARLPLLISHHKCAGAANWGRSVETVGFLRQAVRRQSIHVDVYPYAAGSTILTRRQAMGCDKVMVAWSKSRPEASGRFLAELEKEWDVDRQEAVAMLQPAGAIYFQMHEDDVRRILEFENAIVGSDGLPHDSHPHPRLWGTFPRVIGRYAREWRLFSMETAIRKMTGLTASVFGLSDRGAIAPGMAADLVVFDPERIIDSATYENPSLPADGIVQVWVNGRLAFDGKTTGRCAGRLLKGRPSWR